MKYTMKNLRKYIIASVTLVASALSFGSVAMAQDIGYNKTISGPNEKGVFTLNLEAYATGSVTVETKPSDIILVLDRSGSMNYDMAGNEFVWHGWDYERPYAQDRRINIIKEAVQGFVDNVKRSNVDAQYQDSYGGHRIAIVWFSGENVNDNSAVYTGITGLNEFQKVENLTTRKASGSGNNYQAARVIYNNDYNLLNVNPSGGTYTNKAMQQVESILAAQDYSDKPDRSVIIVFFTDGEPGGYGWNGNDGTTTANGCIQAAYNIKNSTDYKATIYSVGLFDISDNTANRTTTYLSYTSSDYTNKTEMPSSGWVPVSKDKSITVSSAGDLNNIFSSISSSAASAASGSSVLVDIVASNFSIPTNADLGAVTVWRVPCTQASATSMISFSPRNATGDLAWKDITNKEGVTLDKSKQAQGEISVTGFDYGANWCGWDASANNNQGAAHGNKLVLEIPITVKDNIVGGPSLDTNAPGSKLVVKNKEGKVLEELEFRSPVVKVPVTIWIKKEGLLSTTASNGKVQGHEDNAVFTIRKTKFLGRVETDAQGNEIEGGKHIEYTYNNNTEYTIKGVKTKLEWTTFTKVSVNMKENEDGIVKISGLDPDYVYRIEEDAWAHLGYDFDPNATAQYTLVWDEKNKKYIEQTNPFTFSNTPKTTAFYSEDVVRNVFNPGSEKPTEPEEEPAQK